MGTGTTVNSETDTRARRSFATARTRSDSRHDVADTESIGASGNAADESSAAPGNSCSSPITYGSSFGNAASRQRARRFNSAVN